jgi:hypothetical protein
MCAFVAFLGINAVVEARRTSIANIFTPFCEDLLQIGTKFFSTPKILA